MSNQNDHSPKGAKAATTVAPIRGVAAASVAGKDAQPPAPKTWSEVKVGSLVIAHESLEDGWWEAIVTEIKADQLTVRWRDFPRQRPLIVTKKDIAFFPAN